MILKIGTHYVPLENVMYVQDIEEEIRVHLREHKMNVQWLTVEGDEAERFRTWLREHAEDVLQSSKPGPSSAPRPPQAPPGFEHLGGGR